MISELQPWTVSTSTGNRRSSGCHLSVSPRDDPAFSGQCDCMGWGVSAHWWNLSPYRPYLQRASEMGCRTSFYHTLVQPQWAGM